MNIKRNIFLINLYTFFVGTVFMLAIIVPYYQNQIGLTFRQFMIGEAIFAGVIILMEVPSGWMSDVWSRKGTLIIGCISGIIGYSGLMFATGFWSAVVSQAIIGIAVAFNSGTVTSLLYDTLATNKKEHLYQKLEGKRHAIGLYSIASASALGGVLYHYNVYLPLIFDVATIMCAMVCAFFITEPQRIKRIADKTPLNDIIVTMKYALHGHKEIAGIILVSTVLFCTTKMFMWMQQPYMQLVNIPTEYFGFIIAGGFLFGGITGHYGHRIKHNFTNRHMIMILTAIPIIGATIAILFQHQFMIVAILVVTGVWGFGFPFVQNAINKHADPARRATILSTLGLLISLMFIPSSLILGYLDDTYSILSALAYIAVQLFVLSIIGFWLWSRGQSKVAIKP